MGAGRSSIVVAAVLGLGATFGVFWLSQSWEGRVAWMRFQNRAREHVSLIDADLRDSVRLIETFREVFESADRPVSRGEFERLSARLHRRAPGLRDVGWAPRVAGADRAAFVLAVRASGFPTFEILERDAAGAMVPAGARAEYYPILFLDTGGVSRPILGFDLATEPVRRAAIERAIATGAPAATPPLQMITVPRPRGGVMGFVPVFLGRTGGAGTTPDGLVFGAFEIASLMDYVVSQKNHIDDVDLYMLDPDAAVGDRGIYWRSAGPGQAAAPDEAALRSGPHREAEVSIIDQRWRVLLRPAQGLPVHLLTWTSLALPAAGLLLTGIVVSYMAASLRRTRELVALTGDLRATTAGLQAKAEEIAFMAGHDLLTGLPNRRLFAERLAEAIDRVRHSGTQLAVLVLDLDRFKPVNDIYGHAVGDLVLCEVARRLQAIPGQVAVIARFGGDEFAAVVEFTDANRGGMRFAAQVVDALREPIAAQDVVIEVGASVGIATCPRDGMDPDWLLRAADLAMYRAKRPEHGPVCLFELNMDAQLRKRVALERALKRGIPAGEVQPFFQPIVRLGDGAVIGVEVLARWRHPELGLLVPADFLPVAERSGLLPEMTDSLLRQACAAARSWPEATFMALNLSPSQLQDARLPARLMDILETAGLSPTRLEIEVTEAALMRDLELVRTNLRALQAAGVRIALDDFGTGYSSLAHLRDLSFDKLKIDRSFVGGLQGDAEGAKIVEAIVRLGQRFAVSTTAEGIEDPRTAGDMLAMGCDFGQGFHYGRPVPAAEMGGLFKAGGLQSADRQAIAVAS